jgi:NAD(P)-dependent dehydrogenase (short-subunit alcohol dehydrogenase family)
MKNNIFNLENRVAIVTGGNGHLGSSISEGLAESGADVIITGKNQNKIEQISDKINQNVSSNVSGKFLDVQNQDSIIKCFQEIMEERGRIDILVNNASTLPIGKFEDLSNTEWDDGIDGTINGVFRCTKTVIPFLEKSNNTSIINIGSIYGEVSPDPSIYENSGYNSPPQYGSGKAAILQFTRYCAIHLAKKGIRVNSISPGPFPKPEVIKNEKFLNNLKKKIPLNRVGNSDEMKGVVIFLASDASSYITGENIHVDGGWTCW